MDGTGRRGESLPRLVAIMQRLLGEGGCPWDRTQTFDSLKKYIVEEAHEVVDAIESLGPESGRVAGPSDTQVAQPDPGVVASLREELGDLLLQVVFVSEMARSRGWFGPDDVIAAISDKLERRHPHVFGDATVADADEVLANWEKIKAAEKKGKGVLSGMPRGLPALLYANRLGEKASNVGFDWPDAQGPREKIDEELRELDEAIAHGSPEALEHEVGDVLFSVVNVARKRGVDPEAALRKANARFEARFNAVEAQARANGRAIDAHSADELNAMWDEAKSRGL